MLHLGYSVNDRAVGLLWWFSGKESACRCRRCKRPRFDPWVGKIPCKREWQPTPVLLPGESHGQGNLADHTSWVYKESDMTEHTHIYNASCYIEQGHM